MADNGFRPGDLIYCNIRYSKIPISLALRVISERSPENAEDRIMAVSEGGQPYAIDVHAKGVEIRRMNLFERLRNSKLPIETGRRVIGYDSQKKAKYKDMAVSYIPPLR